jgi:hypothetical protein
VCAVVTRASSVMLHTLWPSHEGFSRSCMCALLSADRFSSCWGPWRFGDCPCHPTCDHISNRLTGPGLMIR